MIYKAVAFDMDGTLLNNQKQILPETLIALKAIRDKGIKVILVTGRHHSVIYPYYHQLALSTPAICCNGTYLYDFKAQRYFDDNPMSKSQALALLEKVSEFGVHTLIYTDKYMAYEVFDDHLEGMFKWIESLPKDIQPTILKVDSFVDYINESKEIFKFATSSHDIPRLQAFSNAIEAEGIFTSEWSWINRADIALKGNSKGNGLANWAKNEGIPLSQIAAFGDSYNDLSMLQMAGLGIAMENADDEIKAKADLVIGDNNHPSIAKQLEKMFL